MEIAGKKSSTGLKEGETGAGSEIDAIVEHVENSGNCEFVRILEQYSKMDGAGRKKFLEFAETL